MLATYLYAKRSEGSTNRDSPTALDLILRARDAIQEAEADPRRKPIGVFVNEGSRVCYTHCIGKLVFGITFRFIATSKPPITFSVAFSVKRMQLKEILIFYPAGFPTYLTNEYLNFINRYSTSFNKSEESVPMERCKHLGIGSLINHLNPGFGNWLPDAHL